MIKVTQEMLAAYKGEWHATPPGEPGDRTEAGLEAVLELIDPVPDEVRELETLDNEELRRVMSGSPEAPIGTNVWRHECGCCFSTYAELVADGAIERWRA